MARIASSGGEAVFQISRWLGLNENPDGDTALKMGEAAEIRNFRITAEGHLQKRPGRKTVVSLGAACMGLWTGNVGGTEYTLAAAGGTVWRLDLTAGTKTALGSVASGAKVTFFPFGGKVYILDGAEYRSWDGTTYGPVTGYRPMVSVGTAPAGGGTALEQVNKLTGARRCRFSPDGTATVFHLPEKGIASVDYVRTVADGADMTGWTGDTAAGTVTYTAAPEQGINSIEIGWTHPTAYRSAVTAMRYEEQYNGTTDNRAFLYGDGSNKALYSGIDFNGTPTAEYFPDLNVMAVGDANAPITGMIRQYSRLIVFKRGSTHSVGYSEITLAGGSVTAGFYVTPVNRAIGNEAPGQVQLVTNYPRTLHGGGVYEWKNGNYGLTSDERQARRISRRVENTLASFDLSACVTFDNEYKQDYYIVCGTTAVVHNYTVDAWFVYTSFPASAFTMSGNRLYIGTSDGTVEHVSREYRSDNGAAIDCFWRSGSMDFRREWQRKYSTMIWVSIKPEENARVTVTARSDRKPDYAEKIVASSLASFSQVNYAHFSFNTNRRPQVERVKLKVKKIALYQLLFESSSASDTVTILSTDFRLRYTGYVK